MSTPIGRPFFGWSELVGRFETKRLMNTIYVGLMVVLLGVLAGRKMLRRKNSKNRVVQVVANNCTQCRSCIRKCHHGVLDMVPFENGVRLEVVNADACTGCGDCVGVCNFNALVMVERVNGISDCDERAVRQSVR